VTDGILLCRFHHMLFHNNGWRVIHDAAYYSAVPPASVDATRAPRPLRSKSGALRRLLAG